MNRDDDARLTKGKSTSDDPVGHGLGEEHVCELGEWGFEDEEQGRGHDQSKSVSASGRARAGARMSTGGNDKEEAAGPTHLSIGR